jgi:hypothetical protein
MIILAGHKSNNNNYNIGLWPARCRNKLVKMVDHTSLLTLNLKHI